MGIKTVEHGIGTSQKDKKPLFNIRASIRGIMTNLRTDFGGVPKEAWPNPSKPPELGDIPEHPNI